MQFTIIDVNGAEYTFNTRKWDTQPNNLEDVSAAINDASILFCDKGHIVFTKHIVSLREAKTPTPSTNNVTHVHLDGSLIESVITDKFVKTMARH